MSMNPIDPSSFHSSPLPDPRENRIAKAHAALMDLVENLPQKVPFPFSGAIAFAVGDKGITQAAHFPDAARADSFSPEVAMNVLSTGKLFTSVAVMQLIEERKFSSKTHLKDLLTFEELDLPLRAPYLDEKEDQLPPAQDRYQEITVEQLLSHTAGLGKANPRDKSIEYSDWPRANVGEYGYSNYGFQLLARIIGKHSSQGNKEDHERGFLSHVEERIFKPSNMQSAIRELHQPSDFASRPHRFNLDEKDQLLPIPDKTPEPYPHGNGCWNMPAEDLVKFGIAMRQCLEGSSGHKLVSDQSFLDMLQHRPPLGFKVECDSTGKITGFGHPGDGPGQSAFVHTWLTDPPITVGVVSNYPNGPDLKGLIQDTVIKEMRE